jgi:hypothetical protein
MDDVAVGSTVVEAEGRRLPLTSGVGEGVALGDGVTTAAAVELGRVVGSLPRPVEAGVGGSVRVGGGSTATGDCTPVALAVRSCSSNPPIPSATEANTRLTTPSTSTRRVRWLLVTTIPGLPQRVRVGLSTPDGTRGPPGRAQTEGVPRGSTRIGR